MSTEFDRRRGETQGRIEPATVVPTDGQHVFVLGDESAGEVSILQDNDYTEVEQTVDMTSVDLAGATMDTFGVAMAQFKHPVGLEVDGDTIALWPMDEDYSGIANLVQPGVNLPAVGDLYIANETYSDVGSRSRGIPTGSTTAKLLGVNTPQMYGTKLAAYTAMAWVKFLADDHPTSAGVDPVIFSCVEPGVGGFEIVLAGETGVGTPHRWWPSVRHVDGAGDATVVFTGAPITASFNWQFLAIVFDIALVGPARLKFYQNGSFVTDAATTMVFQAGVPSASGPVQIADPNLWGAVDQFKITDTALTPAQITAAYNACVASQVVNDAAWRMRLLIDGTVYCERTILAGEERRWRDFYAPVRHLTGDHTVTFRLQIEEV
jgi:hypothetical protein